MLEFPDPIEQNNRDVEDARGRRGSRAEYREQVVGSIDELKERRLIGATGEFPDGKLTADDEGELRVAIAAKAGNVVIAFGKQVEWLALDPDQAISIAGMILSKANDIKSGRGR